MLGSVILRDTEGVRVATDSDGLEIAKEDVGDSNEEASAPVMENLGPERCMYIHLPWWP